MARFSTTRILKVNESHGLVFGWAIVSKLRNAAGDLEDYYDLNVDQDGVLKGQRVPEHITEDAVLKAFAEAAGTGFSMVGNVMHKGEDSGHFPGLFPMTEEIAKALGIVTDRTGLLVCYKPEPEVLAKFKNGTFTGFSIEGGRVEHEELEDA